MPAPPERTSAAKAFDLVGTTLRGDAVKIGMRKGNPNTMLAFLSSGCLVCEKFWTALRDEREGLPHGTRVVAVTKDSSLESPTKLISLAPDDLTTVMSSDAWERYDVPGAPYFIYVDGATGRVHGEGAAIEWTQVVSLLQDAMADSEFERERRAASNGPRKKRRRGDRRARGESGYERAMRAEEALARAGIGPGHPSLYASPEEAFNLRPEDVLDVHKVEPKES